MKFAAIHQNLINTILYTSQRYADDFILYYTQLIIHKLHYMCVYYSLVNKSRLTTVAKQLQHMHVQNHKATCWICLVPTTNCIESATALRCLRLLGRYLLFKINFGGVIIVLANKSITIPKFTLLSVSMMISSLSSY